MDVVLTLQIPSGKRFIPIAMTANPDVLLFFKQCVLHDCHLQRELAQDEIEAIVREADFDRLQKVLDLLIPEVKGKADQ